MPVEDRVAAWLAGEDRRDALTEFVAARRFANGFATSVQDGVVLAQLDGAPDDVPASVLRLDENETALRAQVRRMTREGDEVVLEVFAGLRRVDQGGDFPEVAARLLGAGEPMELAADVGPDAAVTRWMGEPHQYHDYGVVAVRIPLSALSTGSWQLELEMQHGGVRRTGLVAELEGHGSAARTLSRRWPRPAVGRDARRGCSWSSPMNSHRAERGAVVRRFETAPGRLLLEVDAPAGATAALIAPGQTVAGTTDGDQWVFELTTDPWKLGPTPAPTGGYRLAVSVDGTELPVTLADEVTDRLPFLELDELHRKAVWRGPRGGLVLRLDPPLSDQEAGPWSQHQLQRSYRAVTEPLDPRLVYFQSFLGQSPTDHPAAIQAELHRVLGERYRHDVRMLWAVQDSSIRVPEGAEPVLLRSREWYDALARAAWVVTNIELDPWFTRREGQEVLETYHGYPSKAMGLAQWRARGRTPTHLQQMLRRTSGSWNNLLTPIPEMDRYYRENYDFEGRIISQGYPRQDALVAPGHEERRAATRERLGIAAHQKAVLYAPTWRDDLATNFRSAQAVLHLSVDQAAQALGPDYVILLRGHRFHAPTRHGARVIDVTGAPRDQRPDPRRRRSGARLLVAALRLRAHRSPDGVPRSRPVALHRADPRLPLRLRRLRARPSRRHHHAGRRGTRPTCPPSNASGRHASPSSTRTTTGSPTVGRPRGWWRSSSLPSGTKRRRPPAAALAACRGRPEVPWWLGCPRVSPGLAPAAVSEGEVSMSSPPARRVLSRVSRVVNRLRRRGVHAQSKVSVVVTARESHAPFLAECLESLSRQTWQNLQILVVPFDGGETPVARAVRRLVETERRLVLVEDAGARTMGAARNAGAARATGEFLVFVGGGDLLPPNAIGREVGCLHQTGSDFARGAVLLGRPKPGELPPGSRVRPVRGASMRSAPLLLSDFFVEGTVFRRSFWTENALSFPDANGPELDVAVARAYVAASAFDVVAGPGYRFMDRGSGRVVGLERDDLRSLDAWLSTQDQVRSLLEGADTAVLQAWITGLMGSSLMALLESAERATPEQWQRLRTTVQEMVDLGGAGLLPQVAVVPRLLAWLAAEDRRTDRRGAGRKPSARAQRLPDHGRGRRRLRGAAARSATPSVRCPTRCSCSASGRRRCRRPCGGSGGTREALSSCTCTRSSGTSRCRPTRRTSSSP